MFVMIKHDGKELRVFHNFGATTEREREREFCHRSVFSHNDLESVEGGGF